MNPTGQLFSGFQSWKEGGKGEKPSGSICLWDPPDELQPELMKGKELQNYTFLADI